jgi:hypothetical protein
MYRQYLKFLHERTLHLSKQSVQCTEASTQQLFSSVISHKVTSRMNPLQ